MSPTVKKLVSDLTMVVHLISPDNSRDMLYLRNYATLNVKDQLAKIQGVGQVGLFGSGDYAMRIWLNPEKVAELGLTADDVINSVKAQNVQAAAGIIGGPPYGDGVQLQLPVNAQGRLTDVDEFGDIIIKHTANGVVAKLKDVAAHRDRRWTSMACARPAQQPAGRGHPDLPGRPAPTPLPDFRP